MFSGQTRKIYLLASLVILSGAMALGDTVTADLTNKKALAKPGAANGTMNLYASSESKGVTNNNVYSNEELGDGSQIDLFTQEAVAKGGGQYTLPGQTAPAVTSKNQLFKPQGGGPKNIAEFFLQSLTNKYTGQAKITPDRIFAYALKGNTPDAGSASGQTVDPVDVSSSYPGGYDPSIDITLQLATGDTGHAMAYATDSAIFTSDDLSTFELDNPTTSDMLWSLNIDENGPLSPTSLTVDFEFTNPDGEIVLPTPMSMTTFDSLVDAQVLAALLANHGNLTDFDPFPDGTTYNPALVDEQYADAVEADLEAGPNSSFVPLPPAVWEGATLLLFLAVISLRRLPRSIFLGYDLAHEPTRD